ncbi:AAA family ATPase [Motiliproteus sp.]|uniref:AAA family ATPase n=1 Tax=Motiliproteus sp. TaxID=1898955 RepID=UPI003BA9CB48
MTAIFNPVASTEVCQPMQAVFDQLNSVVLGKEPQIKLSLTCLLANGHLLLEDLPGMGKTVLSHALAGALGLAYKRVQFTNDLLPADLLGASIYNKDSGEFRFVEGPVFSELLLADEINRATPKTQSALLEAMEERQVSLDGETRPLPVPFFVIATQNPSEQAGTSPLPESQLDRFMVRIQMGYPAKQSELEILAGESRRQLLEQMQPAVSPPQLKTYQQACRDIPAGDQVLLYLYELLQYSRESGLFVSGVSTRGGLAVLNAAKAWAWLSGDAQLMPMHIQAVFPYVVGHRLQRRDGQSDPVRNGLDIIDQVVIPR